jgi:hypothetical protein
MMQVELGSTEEDIHRMAVIADDRTGVWNIGRSEGVEVEEVAVETLITTIRWPRAIAMCVLQKINNNWCLN